MKIDFKSLGIIIAIVIFGGILGASALGLWNTKSIKTPSNIKINESINVSAGEILNHLIVVCDYCAENGLSFGNIKTELQAEIDSLE